MFTKQSLAHLVASAFLALPAVALAQTTSTTTTTTTTSSTSSTSSVEAQATVPTQRLVQKYTPLAGSEKNAQSLVNGLRTGSEVKLTETTSSDGKSTTSTASFTPPTGKMGNGNVNIALSLAEAQLKQAGITEPTAAQLEAALMGGTVSSGGSSGTSTKMEGVLQMRADGKGWGQIANTLGFKLGELMGQGKAGDRTTTTGAQRSEKAKENAAARSERVAGSARPEKVERPQRMERPDKIERPQRPDRPERAAR